MITFCKNKGIQIHETMAYSPQQNEVSERFNRTLNDKIRTMLIESSVPSFLWSEAVYAAVYIINRSPTKSLLAPKAPKELWYKMEPDISKLRVFGCEAFA